MIDRQAVRDTAKYLRQVRPIDPEEITDYLEGQPHPAVIRRVLGEEAVDLGLIEREDGTFVPVSEEPIEPPGWAPSRLPEPYAVAFEDLLADEYGPAYHRGASGASLRDAIRRLKADYFAGADVTYDRTAAYAYGIYHLPGYYAAIGYVLDTLAERGLLSRALRVLDVGAGVGGPALGLFEYLPDDALVEYHAIEPSPAAEILQELIGHAGRNVHPTVHRTTIEAFEPAESIENLDQSGGGADSDGFDLILFSNVLSELDDPTGMVDRSLDWLAPDGSVLALAPADLETATGLRRVERSIETADDRVTVYAPELRLWERETPTDRGWSFDVRPDLEPPSFQERIVEAAREDGGAREEDLPDPESYRNVDVQFAYSILRLDGERRFPFRANPRRHAKMAGMDEHVTDRIDLLAVKLSHDLREDEAANPIVKIGDGSQSIDHYAVVPKRTTLNEALLEAPYGAILSIERTLVLWNDDEAAYNLVVDDETFVETIAG